MCELAAELKKAEAMQPLAAMRMLGELACMDEHECTTSCRGREGTSTAFDYNIIIIKHKMPLIYTYGKLLFPVNSHP